jgi:hypothetical protein
MDQSNLTRRLFLLGSASVLLTTAWLPLAFANRVLTAAQMAAAEVFITENNLGSTPEIEIDKAGRATYSFPNGTRFIIG